MPLATLIEQLRGSRISVNPKYQRSGQVWPARAKSFLVETVLVGMPIPRVLLHKLDDATPPHHSDIIDGQQRCYTLWQFRDNRFALTTDVDSRNLHGRRYRDLTPQQRRAFDSYPVPVDRYRDVTSAQIRQVFRRLNYYTAPLNAAEQRHAQFYGELSRFVEEQAAAWQPTLTNLKVFARKQLTRKADEQLMAEIVDAMLNGISTATAKSLRTVYQRHERQFSSAADFRRRLDRARTALSAWQELRGNSLMKHYHVFSLVVALLHAQGNLASIRDDLGPALPLRADTQIPSALQPLERAVRTRVRRGIYAPFWTASQEKTNVRENRLKRCRYFYAALTGRRDVLRVKLKG
jgi:hypothetical protein